MKRKLYDELLKWKKQPKRKPLILQGARQVGKTFLVNEFGKKEFFNVLYLNFEQEPRLNDLFINIDYSNIFDKLSYLKKTQIIEGQTLIIFDEIQACPAAITSLKYFNECYNNYYIIATGSLLGLAINRNYNSNDELYASFPVGNVVTHTLFPLDFEEFLLALNETQLLDEIKKSFNNLSSLAAPLHERAIKLYKDYLFIGGLPEVVNCYLDTSNEILVQVKQKELIDNYFNDMNKYNSKLNIPKTKLLYEGIPKQLANEVNQFKYSQIKKGSRASEFEDALQWILLSGLADIENKLTKIMLPLDSFESKSDFKFYLNDVGLTCAKMNILKQDLFYDNELIKYFIGGLTENYVFNQLKVNGLKTYYWKSKSDAEVDFITRINTDIIPIEVKASTNTRSKSLNEYVKLFNPKYSIRLSLKNFGFENNIKSIPLYACFLIKN